MYVHHVIYCCQATIEQRKLAVDLAEMVIKWEVQRVKDDQETTEVRVHIMPNKCNQLYCYSKVYCIVILHM